MDNIIKRPKDTKPLDDLYETSVYVKDVDMAVDVVKKWSNFYNNKIYNEYTLKKLKYPAYIYLSNLNKSLDWARDDDGSYAINHKYKPLSYDKFIKLYFYKQSKYVKQLNFDESREDMKIEDKLKKYLGEMDAGHEDFFEIKELERKLKTLLNKKNLFKDEFSLSKIDKEIKKVEDRIRYLKK